MSDIYLSLTETPTVVTLSQPVVSGVLSSNVTVTNVVSVNVVTMPAINVTAAAPSVTTVAGSVAVSNFPSVTTVAGTVALDANSLSALENVTVTVGAAVTVAGFSTSSLPPSTVTVANTVTIAGTVTAVNQVIDVLFADTLEEFNQSSAAYAVGVHVKDLAGNVLGSSGSPLPISGTVTANGGDFTAVDGSVTIPARAAAIGFYDTAGNGLFKLANSDDQLFPVRVANLATTQGISGTVTVGNSVTIGSLPNSLSIVNSSSVTKANVQYTAIAGSINSSDGASSYTMRPVAVNSSGQIYIDANPAGQSVFSNDGTSHIFVKPTPNTSVTIGSLPAISGTVTAAASNGSLTTRFGTPTTANVSFATSAVTNANRKYLLIQNVTTGSNVITVGIGFTPTTTQGIQLTAGAGITFESSYIPTGQIFVLSSVTASNFTILEA